MANGDILIRTAGAEVVHVESSWSETRRAYDYWFVCRLGDRARIEVGCSEASTKRIRAGQLVQVCEYQPKRGRKYWRFRDYD